MSVNIRIVDYYWTLIFEFKLHRVITFNCSVDASTYSFEKWMEFIVIDSDEPRELSFDGLLNNENVSYVSINIVDNSISFSINYDHSDENDEYNFEFSLAYDLVKEQLKNVILEARERKLHFEYDN